jgi:hypothetical protein
MKSSKVGLHRKTQRIPEIRFEDQHLISFAGLILFQSLFTRIGLKKLSNCFRPLQVNPVYGHGLTVMLLIVHLLLGFRQLKKEGATQLLSAVLHRGPDRPGA